MQAVIVSDLHIGSRYFMLELFRNFLSSVPEKAELILNGDTLDRRRRHMSQVHQGALNLILDESRKRRVVWIWGNHDWKFRPAGSESVEFVKQYSIGRKLFLSHGYNFDFITPVNRPVMTLIRIVYDWYHSDTARPQRHVALTAKKFARLYGVLRRHIAKNAVRYAKKHGYEAAACGHTHYAEDVIVDGVRYLNTGAWTEEPAYYISVHNGAVELRKVGSA